MSDCSERRSGAEFFRNLLVESVRQILESSYPGYDIERKRMGCLFPNHELKTACSKFIALNQWLDHLALAK